MPLNSGLALGGDHPFAPAISDFISGNATDKLHLWVKDQRDPFCLATAAKFLKIDEADLTRGIQTRIGLILRNLGCTRFEGRSATSRYYYLPPPGEKTEIRQLAAIQ
ncbi:MAG: hypothetical protein H0U72_10430 [Nitrosospira sp.]|nr:hypothetical protein [Nitrosospira sp.]